MGASGMRKRCTCRASQAPLSWVSVPISSTTDVCPQSGGTSRVPAEPRGGAQQGTRPPRPAAPHGAKSPAFRTFLLVWDRLHPHQREPSRGGQGVWGQPPEPAGTAGTLWARRKQCRIHAVTPFPRDMREEPVALLRVLQQLTWEQDGSAQPHAGHVSPLLSVLTDVWHGRGQAQDTCTAGTGTSCGGEGTVQPLGAQLRGGVGQASSAMAGERSFLMQGVD